MAPYHPRPARVTPSRECDFRPTQLTRPFAFYGRTPLLYDAAMNILGDWKWYAALTVFVLFMALVVWLPGPQAESAAVNAVATPTASPADLTPVRPPPTPAEHDAMLQYSVQEGDTVAGIARLFRVTEENLRWANHIPDGGGFDPGDKIWLPAP